MSPSTLIFGAISALLLHSSAFAANWPAWRGPTGDGIATDTDLPLKWSATENVKWKTPLPQPGNSSPIVWGDRVFVTQTKGDQRLVIAFDRQTGKPLWEAGPSYTGKEPTHPTNTLCSASPTTDGERVYAYFGSAGLHAFDFAGKPLWKVELGAVDHAWGYAISPVVHGDLVFQANGAGADWWLAGFDKKTGKEVWRVKGPPINAAERTDGFAGKNDGMVGSWSTPVIVSTAGREALVMTWPEKLVAYDPATGRELWRAAGLNPLLYTSPMPGDGAVIGSGGYGGTTIVARAASSGDVTDQLLWKKPRDKQRIGSGVIRDGYFYILNTPGTAQCIKLSTGEQLWEERVGSGGKSQSWSSMVLSGDRIYMLNQNSDTVVLRASPKFEVLAVNSLGDGLTNSSHAISGGEIFIRTHQHLWCIGSAR